jgi:hypothetical protein
MTKGIYHQAARMLTKEGNLDHHSMIIQRLLNALDACRAAKNLHAMRSEKLQEELARLREIAIEATATRLGGLPNTGPCKHRTGYEYCELLNGICDGYPHMLTICPSRDHWRAIAARALDIQTSREDDYLKRLETAYLDAKKGERYFGFYAKMTNMMLVDAYDLAVKDAQVALGKIRAGGQP